MPSEIESFEPVVDVNDDEWGSYEDVVIDTKPTETEDSDSHIKSIMFALFEEYSECENIKGALRSLHSAGEVSDTEYNLALEQWDEYLTEWTATRIKLD